MARFQFQVPLTSEGYRGGFFFGLGLLFWTLTLMSKAIRSTRSAACLFVSVRTIGVRIMLVTFRSDTLNLMQHFPAKFQSIRREETSLV